MRTMLVLLGLFIPIPIDHAKAGYQLFGWKWGFTFTVGRVPLGWIIAMIAYMVQRLAQ